MWEYKQIKGTINSEYGSLIKQTLENLNTLGEEGWELVSVIQDAYGANMAIFFLKKQINGGEIKC